MNVSKQVEYLNIWRWSRRSSVSSIHHYLMSLCQGFSDDFAPDSTRACRVYAIPSFLMAKFDRVTKNSSFLSDYLIWLRNLLTKTKNVKYFSNYLASSALQYAELIFYIQNVTFFFWRLQPSVTSICWEVIVNAWWLPE